MVKVFERAYHFGKDVVVLFVIRIKEALIQY